MADGKQILLKELADLLGFEDGAEDVLEHLLTSVDTRVDLLDYLEQLLGSSNDKVRSFVDHVDAFQKGEVLTATKAVTVELAAIVETKQPANNASSKKTPVPTSTSTKAAATKIKQSPPPSENAVKDPPPSAQPLSFQPNEESVSAPPSPERKENPPPKSVPKKGKASYVCGCYGTQHKPLANCLVCGRISCDREGYDYCPYCGILVEPPPEGVSRNDPAWLHKERLLRFDRESAQRMIVIGDESDYNANQMAWLTQEESEAAAAQQEDHERNLRSRPKMQLDLAL